MNGDEENPTRFLLYIDILGFKEMTLTEPRKVARIYAILDKLNAHKHPNFQTIVFSDTILTYNPEEVHNKKDREYLVWYLTEFAEDLHHRLIGQDIWFRAVLIAGDFNHYPLENIECFYGKALIDAYHAEAGLPMIGLAMHETCLPYNRYFHLEDFGKEFSFVYLSRQLEGLKNFSDKFPSEYWEISDAVPQIPEAVRFLKDIYSLMRNHPQPSVRAKALSTWDFYIRRYPEIVSALLSKSFDISALGPQKAWSQDIKALESNIQYYKRAGSGTSMSVSINKKRGHSKKPKK